MTCFRHQKGVLQCQKGFANRRVAFVILLVSALLFTAVFASIALRASPPTTAAQTPLNIPTLIDSRTQNGPIVIDITKGEHAFFLGVKSTTRGYNGGYLGPTIKMYKGENTDIQFTNHLDEPTNIHGHGLHVEGKIDGGPQNKIMPGETWSVTIPVSQQASTNWYHPHLKGSTASQVHSGLAGFYLIEDAHSMSLGLPNSYGIDDIPLVIQDRSFVDGKMTPYPTGNMPEDLREDTLVVNGTVNPYTLVPRSFVRLRLLNGSNARSYEFYLEGDQPFYKIATEGGLLPSPVELTSLKMAPGERNDIVVDMSVVESQRLLARLLPMNYNGFNAVLIPFSQSQSVLELRGDDSLKVLASELPKQLNTITPYLEKDVEVERVFELGDMSINGQQMNMKVINHESKLGQLEKWTIDSGRHPFHMHGTSFLILSMNGKPPAPEDQGWKDTIYPNGTAEILLKFDYEATEQWPYMYHCHILEHEDMGMMGQFTVK
ncbi:multicopper oxidase domain-containing protein [Enterovibrio sp. ZSDZ42]|uniref:Multicopper oxidase domain-containing protein n=1 Tax=Enterovibrio gelatinilyticus TaxID=2899819 RepID=A0ABT5R3S4_9GAMM|nr:multicopper oxidase domain-containing protein [Enterovibrio sp. ZSDZ42]MDD1794898.1 multicopper oxidase domain-containing protein [Enterovibrio sp. ZSDZ42]